MLWVEELTLYFIANQKANAESFAADSCFAGNLSQPTYVLLNKIRCDMSFISKKSESLVGLAEAKFFLCGLRHFFLCIQSPKPTKNLLI